jgi:hypothetical protein
MLSAHAESIILSALPAESIVVSAPPTESMILPVLHNLQALMLWQFIIAGTKEHFEGHTHPRPPPKYICKLRRLSSIHLKHWRGAQGLILGARGPFLPAAAMVVVVVTPDVFCAMATEKNHRIIKISFLLAKSLFITIHCKTYCNSYIANCSVA